MEVRATDMSAKRVLFGPRGTGPVKSGGKWTEE